MRDARAGEAVPTTAPARRYTRVDRGGRNHAPRQPRHLHEGRVDEAARVVRWGEHGGGKRDDVGLGVRAGLIHVDKARGPAPVVGHEQLELGPWHRDAHHIAMDVGHGRGAVDVVAVLLQKFADRGRHLGAERDVVGGHGGGVVPPVGVLRGRKKWGDVQVSG